MFFKKKEFCSASSPEFLIVGLGNPGEKYEYTRHNAGFLTLDRLCVEENFKINKIKYKSVIGEVNICSHKCIAMKPQTFMNNSGEAVKEAASFYKIPPERIIVIFDDISLPCGKLRIRRKGSDGGHNGIKSIIYLRSPSNHRGYFYGKSKNRGFWQLRRADRAGADFAGRGGNRQGGEALQGGHHHRRHRADPVRRSGDGQPGRRRV